MRAAKPRWAASQNRAPTPSPVLADVLKWLAPTAAAKLEASAWGTRQSAGSESCLLPAIASTMVPSTWHAIMRNHLMTMWNCSSAACCLTLGHARCPGLSAAGFTICLSSFIQLRTRAKDASEVTSYTRTAASAPL